MDERRVFLCGLSQVGAEMKKISDRVYLCYPIPPYGEKWKQRDGICVIR